MCINLRHLRKDVPGEGIARVTLARCGHCWRCRSNRVNDWVGRAIAENEVCTKAFFVTLTYGHTDKYGEPLDERARTLDYSDVQRWLKRIRKAGHTVRYIVAGEYGPLKGRTHWHAILFFYGKIPDIRPGFKYWNTGPKTMDPFWQDGQTLWKLFHPKAAKYVCKYMLKSEDPERPCMARLSKKPPIGHLFFKQRAEEYVKLGLSPQDAYYHFRREDGSRQGKVRYRLEGASLRNFIHAFMAAWIRRHGRDNWPHSQFIEDFRDKEARPRVEQMALIARLEKLADQSLQRQQERELQRATEGLPRKPDHLPVPYDKMRLAFGVEVKLQLDSRHVWVARVPALPHLAGMMWDFDENGFPQWRNATEIPRGRKTAYALRAAYGQTLKPPEIRLGERVIRESKKAMRMRKLSERLRASILARSRMRDSSGLPPLQRASGPWLPEHAPPF